VDNISLPSDAELVHSFLADEDRDRREDLSPTERHKLRLALIKEHNLALKGGV